MRLPIYHKIMVNNFSYQEVLNSLKVNQVGKVPTWLEIKSSSQDLALQNLELIHKCLEDLEVHPRFPYPLYIICKSVQKFQNLIIVNNVSQLPRYYNKKIKRLKVREQNILNKTELQTQRILNQELNLYWRSIENNKTKNKYLNILTFELDAYEKILERLETIENENNS